MNVFFDSEFSTLPDKNNLPRLISLGCVAQDGKEWYGELSDTYHVGLCSKFVVKTVLPLLNGGECRLKESELAVRLKDWIARSLRVHTAFHGHQHDRLDYSDHHERMGFKSYGVGFCGITDQDGNVICEGDFDEQNEQRYQQYRWQGKV